MAKITSKMRDALPRSQFAIPSKRAYPIPDKAHAVDALARVEANGTPQEKAQVRAAVRRKFPDLPSSKGKGDSKAAAANK
jgi:hypothetical protein